MTSIQRALSGFQGIGRRLEVLGDIPLADGKALLVDDYGHHPKEIAASVHAVRESQPGRRLVVAFQPHRYTRTRDLFDDFCQVLSAADVLLLSEVYAAGETPIPEADGRALSKAIRARGRLSPIFLESVHELPAMLPGVLKDGDVLLTLGAGDIGAVAAGLIQAMTNSPVRGAGA
jgi:UDP-N-acetylmuramate--alanine ligase